MMDYSVLIGHGLTRLDAAKVLPLVLLVCQRGCKQPANPLKGQGIKWREDQVGGSQMERAEDQEGAGDQVEGEVSGGQVQRQVGQVEEALSRRLSVVVVESRGGGAREAEMGQIFEVGIKK
jgi:hypothetical protein